MDQIQKMVQPMIAAAKPLSPLGPQHIERFKKYGRGAAFFGLSGAILGCYMLEWKAVLQFLPYYNGKYKEE